MSSSSQTPAMYTTSLGVQTVKVGYSNLAVQTDSVDQHTLFILMEALCLDLLLKVPVWWFLDVQDVDNVYHIIQILDSFIYFLCAEDDNPCCPPSLWQQY